MTSWEDLYRLKGVFDRFDEDQNGTIDRDEFAQFLAAIGKQMSSDQVATGFAQIDRDGSGQIEFDEFVDWWEQRGG